MSGIVFSRRIVIALTAVMLSALLMHGQVASALVTRGDDALRSGDETGAFAYYRRALRFDPASSVAADRLAFHLALHGTRDDEMSAIAVASTALNRRPNDPALLADRAFAEQRLRDWERAQNDFGAAAALTADARYAHFAARIALRRGHIAEARQFLLNAVRDDAHFAPARILLTKLEHR